MLLRDGIARGGIQTTDPIRYRINGALAAFGSTPALAQAKALYFDSGVNRTAPVTNMDARGLTGKCVIGRASAAAATYPMFKCVPDDGGPQIWENERINLDTSSRSGTGLQTDANYAYVALNGDGTIGTASRLTLVRLNMTDGTQDYMTAAEAGGAGLNATALTGMSLSPVADEIYFNVGAAGDELKRHTASTGASINASGTTSFIGTFAALCVSPDEDYVCVVSTNEFVGRWSTPVASLATTIDGTSSGYVNIGLAGSTTLKFNVVASSSYCARMLPARDGGNTVWFCGGYFGSGDCPFVMQYDPASGTPGSIITEIDVSDSSGLTDNNTGRVVDIAVDKFGYVYALYVDAFSAANADIVRYQPDGTFDLSFAAKGATLPTSSDDLATRIAVSEDGKVFLGDRGGYVWVYTQG